MNIALVVWLIRNKRLFGLRGGLKAMHEEVDWGSILASPTPALGRRAIPATRPPTVHGDDDIEAAAD